MPFPILAAGAAVVIAAGAFTAGWRVNSWRHDSQALAIEQAAQKASQAVSRDAVAAIQGIRIKYVTVQQNAETITREIPVYRDGHCEHDPRMRDAINQALTATGDRPVGVPGELGTAGR